MKGFYVSALSHVFHLALLNDGARLSEKEIETCIRKSVTKNKTALHDDVFIPDDVMFLIFADMADEIGRALDREIGEEGFALDWADEYPSFQQACLGVRRAVLEGFSIPEEDIAPEIAAVQLEVERHNPTFH